MSRRRSVLACAAPLWLLVALFAIGVQGASSCGNNCTVATGTCNLPCGTCLKQPVSACVSRASLLIAFDGAFGCTGSLHVLCLLQQHVSVWLRHHRPSANRLCVQFEAHSCHRYLVRASPMAVPRSFVAVCSQKAGNVTTSTCLSCADNANTYGPTCQRAHLQFHPPALMVSCSLQGAADGPDSKLQRARDLRGRHQRQRRLHVFGEPWCADGALS